MEKYSLMREFADSWMLLFLFLVFVGVCFWAFRPGSRAQQDDVANSIFRHDKKPAGEFGVRDQRSPNARQPEEA